MAMARKTGLAALTPLSIDSFSKSVDAGSIHCRHKYLAISSVSKYQAPLPNQNVSSASAQTCKPSSAAMITAAFSPMISLQQSAVSTRSILTTGYVRCIVCICCHILRCDTQVGDLEVLDPIYVQLGINHTALVQGLHRTSPMLYHEGLLYRHHA